MDYGHEWTDEGLKDLEKRITKEWTQAAKEVQEKLDAYIERFKEKDERKRQQVKDGEITQDEYTRWRYGQVMIQGRWEEMRDTLAEDLTLTGEKTDSMTQEFCYDAYALNHNYGTFEVEQGAMVDTSYTLYDRSTVERLVRDNPQMLPPPGEKVSEQIRRGEAKLWNQKQIQSVMTQALLQGESMPKIAKRLAEAVGDRDKNASIRNARTMVTGAENAGRQDSYDRAEKMGIPVRKQWLATLDGRTRHEHRQLDGMIVDNDKPFKIGDDKIRYPGDPEAPGYLIYNCFPGDIFAATDSEILRSYKHKYDGELIEIECASGTNFACTPNHPILCPSGWVPAKFLHNGDNLLVALRGNSILPDWNPNIEHTFTRMKTIHNLHKFLFGCTERSGHLPVDFHGDVATSDVEIICKKRLLRNNRNPGFCESIAKFFFKLPDTFLFCKSHLVKGFRGIDISSFGFMCGRRKPTSFFRRSVGHSDIHRFRTPSDMDIVLPEYSIDDLPTETVIRSELLNGLSGKVFVDNVISVKRRIFKGHVYNLQTKNGYYFVDNIINHKKQKDNGNYSIIAKNCRCTLIAAIKGFESDLSDISKRNTDHFKSGTYEQWKKEKEKKGGGE